jgi:cytochrome b
MTLKMHIGFFVLLSMALTLIWGLREDLREDFKWYVPTGAALMVVSVVEPFIWIFWWFFIA